MIPLIVSFFRQLTLIKFDDVLDRSIILNPSTARTPAQNDPISPK